MRSASEREAFRRFAEEVVKPDANIYRESHVWPLVIRFMLKVYDLHQGDSTAASNAAVKSFDYIALKLQKQFPTLVRRKTQVPETWLIEKALKYLEHERLHVAEHPVTALARSSAWGPPITIHPVSSRVHFERSASPPIDTRVPIGASLRSAKGVSTPVHPELTKKSHKELEFFSVVAKDTSLTESSFFSRPSSPPTPKPRRVTIPPSTRNAALTTVRACSGKCRKQELRQQRKVANERKLVCVICNVECNEMREAKNRVIGSHFGSSDKLPSNHQFRKSN